MASVDITLPFVTNAVNDMVGDSGAGGTHGLVPAPAAGDAAANKFLKADGTWAAASAPATNTFATIQTDAGTSPVADSSTDTLTLTSTDLVVTGNSTTDTITLALAAKYKPAISGTRAAPVSVTNTITPPGGYVQKIYVEGNGGDVVVTSIAAGTYDGEELLIVGCNDSKRVSINTVAGIKTNGECNLGADWALRLSYDLSKWSEVGRSEKYI